MGLVNVVAGPTRSKLRGPWVGLWLYGLGMLGRAAQVLLLGQLGYVGDPTQAVAGSTWYAQILAILSLFGLCGLATVSWQYFSRKTRTNALFFWLILAIEASYGLATGMKQSVVMTFIAILAGYGMVHRRFSWKIILAAAMIILFVVVPVNENYRDVARQDGAFLTPQQAVVQLPRILSRTPFNLRNLGPRLPTQQNRSSSEFGSSTASP